MTFIKSILFIALGIALSSCTKKSDIPVNKASVEAGTSVTMKGERVELHEGRLPISEDLVSKLDPEIQEKIKGKIAVISVVPSLETKVCDAQTHALGEAKNLSDKVVRVTISRDLPMAQERFAREAKLENISYFSDYKFGNFGRNHGLMMKGKELLARAVIVVDHVGVIRHVQIVPEVTELPDMEAAIAVANKLAE